MLFKLRTYDAGQDLNALGVMILQALLNSTLSGIPITGGGALNSTITLPKQYSKSLSDSIQSLMNVIMANDPARGDDLMLALIPSVPCTTTSYAPPPPSIGTFAGTVDIDYAATIYPVPGYDVPLHSQPLYLHFNGAVRGTLSVIRNDKVLHQTEVEPYTVYLYFPERHVRAFTQTIDSSYIATDAKEYGGTLFIAPTTAIAAELVSDVYGTRELCAEPPCPNPDPDGVTVFPNFIAAPTLGVEGELDVTGCCLPCNVALAFATRFILRVTQLTATTEAEADKPLFQTGVTVRLLNPATHLL